MRPRRARGGSTTTVLWLMILLVFVPIAAGHVVARYTRPDPGPEQQAAKTG